MEHLQLPNSLNVFVDENHTSPCVAIQIWIGVGSADETAAEAGLAHVHEHMLFKGTRKRPVGQIASEIESLGGEINAYTSFDETVYYVVAASRYFEKAVDVLTDAVLHPAFDAEELEREKEVILEEIKRGEDQPARRLSQGIFSTAFLHHPYRLPVIGTSDSVRSFRRTHVLNFYRKFYVPNNMAVVIAGDVTPAKAFAAVKKAFRGVRPRPVKRPSRRMERVQKAPRGFVERGDMNDIYYSAAYHIPDVTHEDCVALDLLANILGGSESSRLVNEVKNKKNLVSEIYAYAYTPRDAGVFMTGGNLFQGREVEAIQAIIHEITRIQHTAPGRSEFERARLNLESDLVYLKETVQGLARKWGFYHMTARDLDFERRYLDRLANTQPADVSAAAQKFLHENNLTFGLMGPGNTGRSQEEKETIQSAIHEAYHHHVRHHSIKAAKPPRPLPGDDITVHELPNGMRLVVRERHSTPTLAIKCAMRGGSLEETPDQEGIGAFVAEMLTKGTPSRSAEKIACEAEAMAGSIGGYSGRNSIGLEITTLSRFHDRAVELYADVLLNPVFPDSEAVPVRAEFLAAIERERDQLSSLTFANLRKAVFGTHPYAFRIHGNADTVKSFDNIALKNAYRKRLDPKNLWIAVVGDIDTDEAVHLFTRTVGQFQNPEAVIATKHPEPELSGRKYVEAIADRAQAHLALGFLGASIDSEDRYAIDILNTVLSGQGGRLFLELRDRQSLAYTVTTSAVEGIGTGLFAGYIGTSPDKMNQALDSMVRELEKIRETPISRSELDRAKRYLSGTFEIELQRSSSQASNLCLNALYGLGVKHHLEYPERIRAVTREDVLRIARKYLDFSRTVLSVTRPAHSESLESRWMEDRLRKVV